MTRLARSTGLVLLTVAGLALVWLFREPIMIFLVGVFLAASLRPFIERLRRRGLSPAVSLAIVYGMLAVGLVALVVVAVGPLARDVQALVSRLALAYEQATVRWPDLGNSFQRAIASRLPPPALIYKALGGQTEVPVVERMLAMVGNVGSLLGKGVMVLILSLYWSTDQVRFERLWLSSLSLGVRVAARRVWRDLETGVGAVVRSTAVQVALSALVLWAGFALLGVPYASLLAVFGGLVQLVPWLGVVLAALPFLFVAWVGDPAVALAGAVFSLAVVLIFDFQLQPRFFPRTQISSLLFLLVALVLAVEAGLAGLILAPATTVAVQVLWIHLVEPQRRAVPISTTMDDLEMRFSQLQESLSQSPEPVAPEVSHLVSRLGGAIAASKEL